MKSALLFIATLCCGIVAMLLVAVPANAQATRTWVSGVGDDANPCSRTAPCKTFAGAISKTAAGGEIDALDPAGYGAVTITKSITIDGGGGQVASVLVAGTNGIIVNAAATDIVILRNLRFQGVLGNGANAGNAGLTAINFVAGANLIVDHCDIMGFNVNGIAVSSSTAGAFAAINNTTIANVNNAGIIVNGNGNKASVNNVEVWRSKFGISVANGNKVSVLSSIFANATTAAIEVDAGGSLWAEFAKAIHSVTGISNAGLVISGQSVIAFNTTGIVGTLNSFGNNRIGDNTSDGATPVVGPATTDHDQK